MRCLYRNIGCSIYCILCLEKRIFSFHVLCLLQESQLINVWMIEVWFTYIGINSTTNFCFTSKVGMPPRVDRSSPACLWCLTLDEKDKFVWYVHECNRALYHFHEVVISMTHFFIISSLGPPHCLGRHNNSLYPCTSSIFNVCNILNIRSEWSKSKIWLHSHIDSP